MRREREWDLAKSILKQNTFASQAIEIGGFNFRVAVAGKVIGAKRIYRDEQDVCGGRFFLCT